jgi:hypothetical protein
VTQGWPQGANPLLQSDGRLALRSLSRPPLNGSIVSRIWEALAVDSKELLERLAREGINPSTYRVETISGGGGPGDCYCLRRRGPSWEVTYRERGPDEVLGIFATEAEACDDLFARLDREATARSHLLTWFSEKAKADEFVAILLQAGIKPTHRDAPAFANRSDIRYRIFVDGRELEAANKIRERHCRSETRSTRR